jgi:hypothetical protein
MLEPSDWENGVLAAAKWLRRKGHADLAGEMIRQLPTDQEGTEARVVQQIAAWLDEQAVCRDESSFGSLVRDRCWRQA